MKFNKIILHCSDSDIPAHDNVQVIRSWHLQRGWNDIGYHYYINYFGDIFLGRNISRQGAHCKNHNKDSLGICYGGASGPNVKQLLAMKRIIHAGHILLDIPLNEVYGHYHFNSGKTCPNFDVDKINWRRGAY